MAETDTPEKLVYTKYEKARMIGSRALQISMGAPSLVKIETAELEKLRYSPIEIAKREFDAGVIPITVRRPLPKRIVKGEKAEKKAA